MSAAQELAEGLLARHLPGWTLTWNRARRRLAFCNCDSQVISLSRHLTAVLTEAELRDVVLHEIAHGLVGCEHQHDASWKAQARALGAVPRAQRPVANSKALPAPWIGKCASGHEFRRFRRPERVGFCGICSTPDQAAKLIHWELHGEPTIPPGRYAREWKKTRRLLQLR